MNDPILTIVLMQEVERVTRKQHFGAQDPDELYKQEMWDSLDSAPSFKALFHRIASFVTRRNSTFGREQGAKAQATAQSTQCAPQR